MSGASLKYTFTDTCCGCREIYEDIFPDALIKLDLFHAFQRITKLLADKRSNLAQRFSQLFSQNLQSLLKSLIFALKLSNIFQMLIKTAELPKYCELGDSWLLRNWNALKHIIFVQTAKSINFSLSTRPRNFLP